MTAAARWGTLPNAGPGGLPVGQDPVLSIADALGFADHGGAAPGRLWPVSIQVDDPSYRPLGIPDLQLRAGHADSAFFTALASRPAMSALLADSRVLRVQFAAAQVPARPWPQLLGTAATAGPGTGDPGGDSPGPVLLGVIDDGCPFAHPDLLRADGSLRVLRLWNQDSGSTSPAGAPPPFGYGAEFTRADLQALRAAASGPAGVDAAACYNAAGQPRLRHARSHGAHVLGLLAGARRWNLSPRGPGPLVTASAGKATRSADIAFVQLPTAVLHSVSVPALEHHAWDGIRYLCELAAARGCARLVIVLSYESWLGPHDGSSWFEQALDSLLDPARGGPASLAGLDIRLVMPAGNSRQRSVHAHVPTGAATETLHWQLPPGNEDPMYLELWAPAAAPGLQLRVTPPGALPSPWQGWGDTAAWGTAANNMASLVMQAAVPGVIDRPRALLRVAPTSALQTGPAAPHGIWTLQLQMDGGGALPDLHARIGRVEPALPVPKRNRQPQFVQRTPAQANDDRLHTLNGHACGHHVDVAGALLGPTYPLLDEPAVDSRGQPRRYVLPGHAPTAGAALRNQSAAYSGSGPTEGPRAGPDVSLPVEDGLLWPGVLSLGGPAAMVFRQSGTSAAAPLWARELADRSIGAPIQQPRPTPGPVDPARGRATTRS